MLRVALLLLIIFAGAQVQVNRISLDMESKTLSKGKVVVVTGTVFYKTDEGRMVTWFRKPEELYVITNKNGEFKTYSPKDNSVIHKQSMDFSSKNSYLYYFLSGKTQEMGLPGLGLELKSTKTAGKRIVLEWALKPDFASDISKGEIALENNRPVFVGLYDAKGKLVSKAYFTQYSLVGPVYFPMTVTEISYFGEKDSTIVRRKYSNGKINDAVDNTKLNFQVPINAKVVAPK